MITAIKFILFLTILLDVVTIYKVLKDNQFLLDSDKPKLYLITILIPIFGALYALKRVGFKFLNFIYPIGRTMNNKNITQYDNSIEVEIIDKILD